MKPPVTNTGSAPKRTTRLNQPVRITLWVALAAIGIGGWLPNKAISNDAADDASAAKPNIIFIMADDLGYGELGCYGQSLIQTPRLDAMAAQGIRFTDFYAGSTVCAPSRSVLMTGLHTGHTSVRGNARPGDASPQSLQPDDVTVAQVLKQGGYHTALCGKWGLGDDAPGGHSGLPRRQGFDFFYGYLNQHHAHNYYPEFLWRNETKEPLGNRVTTVRRNDGGFDGGWATERIDYSHDRIMAEALSYIRSQADDDSDAPFFLYLALTIPHANNEGFHGTGDGQEVPDYGIYADRDWPNPDKGQAAMITRMDADIGRMLDLLAELKIDQQTVVFFTSDNGPHNEGGHDPRRFVPSGPLRGMKRDLSDGGIRVPLIVRWPGTTPPGTTSAHIGYFGDLMATAAQLAGVATPVPNDSISLVPTITGDLPHQAEHEYLYWEFYEQGGKQAVRYKNWKAIRHPWKGGPIALFDLSNDLDETDNVAERHPELVAKIAAMMDQAHQPSDRWTIPPAPRRK